MNPRNTQFGIVPISKEYKHPTFQWTIPVTNSWKPHAETYGEPTILP